MKYYMVEFADSRWFLAHPKRHSEGEFQRIYDHCVERARKARGTDWEYSDVLDRLARRGFRMIGITAKAWGEG